MFDRYRPERRPAVNIEGSKRAEAYFDNDSDNENNYENLLARSCKWCNGAIMVWRDDIQSYFCCLCGESKK